MQYSAEKAQASTKTSHWNQTESEFCRIGEQTHRGAGYKVCLAVAVTRVWLFVVTLYDLCCVQGIQTDREVRIKLGLNSRYFQLAVGYYVLVKTLTSPVCFEVQRASNPVLYYLITHLDNFYAHLQSMPAYGIAADEDYSQPT